MKIENPCYKCSQRYVGCHSVCDDWNDYLSLKKVEYERRKKISQEYGDYTSYSIDRLKRKYRKVYEK